MGKDAYSNIRGRNHNFYKNSHRKRYNYVPHFELRNTNYIMPSAYDPWISQKFYNRRGGPPFRNKIFKKPPSRPSSPLCGTEEYMQRKIQKASDLIKQQILSGEAPSKKTIAFNKGVSKNNKANISKKPTKKIVKPQLNNSNQIKEKQDTIVPNNLCSDISSSDLEEIHDKILNRILNLNYGRKMNLINATSSGYDIAIQQIQKQKRLELSRALRNMCSNDVSSSSAEVINAIIPDIGIKIEDLPIEVIEKLSSTLDFNIDLLETESTCNNFIEPSAIKSENFDDDYELISEDHHNSFVIENSGSYYNQLHDNDNKLEENADVSQHNYLIANTSSPFSFMKEYDDLVKSVTDHVNDASQNVKAGIFCNNPVVINTSEEKTLFEDSPSIDTFNKVSIKQEASNVDYQYPLPNLPNTHNENKSDDTKSILERTKKILQEDAPRKRTNSRQKNILEEKSRRTSLTEENKNNFTEIIKTNTEEFCSEKLDVSSTKISDDNKFSTSSQTDNIFNENPSTMEEAISLMFKIDAEINKLTAFRQKIFTNLQNDKKSQINQETLENQSGENDNLEKNENYNVKKDILIEDNCNVYTEKKDTRILTKRKNKIMKNKKRLQMKPVINTGKYHSSIAHNSRSYKNVRSKNNNSEMDTIISQYKDQKISMNFKLSVDLHEKVLVIDSIGNTLLVGSESGKIYIFNLLTGKLIYTLEVAPVPVTSLCLWKPEEKPLSLYVGCLEEHLKVYNLANKKLIKSIYLDGDSAQCIEKAWGYLFIGCNRGNLFRYCLKKEKVEYQDKISISSILVLKATTEGGRKVLLVGTRNAAVCVRDAMSGLHMRTMDNIISPTVYSLLLKDSTVYCGTTSHDILVFGFHDGKLVEKLKASNAKGVGCMKIVRNLLYASCYDGNVYVYQTKPRRFIGEIQGPGGIILSMDVIDRKIFIGTMSFKFEAIDIPSHILNHTEENAFS